MDDISKQYEKYGATCVINCGYTSTVTVNYEQLVQDIVQLVEDI